MDHYIKKISEQLASNAVIEDYLVLLERYKLIHWLLPWCVFNQFVIFVTNKNEVYITKLSVFAQFLTPILIPSSSSFSVHKKKMTISNFPRCDGKYTIIRKYKDGRFNTKEEMYQFLMER